MNGERLLSGVPKVLVQVLEGEHLCSPHLMLVEPFDDDRFAHADTPEVNSVPEVWVVNVEVMGGNEGASAGSDVFVGERVRLSDGLNLALMVESRVLHFGCWNRKSNMLFFVGFVDLLIVVCYG